MTQAEIIQELQALKQRVEILLSMLKPAKKRKARKSYLPEIDKYLKIK